ncbi:MAG: hypothetical protein ABSA33_00755 [Candidatus Micrarchaeaceae archaeon]|jgi:hypothetical protein
MESKSKCERELERCIDSMVDEVSGMYCADLAEHAKVDSKMSDIKFREELIGQIKDEIRCKKICERMMAEQNRSLVYGMQVSICKEGIEYSVTR